MLSLSEILASVAFTFLVLSGLLASVLGLSLYFYVSAFYSAAMWIFLLSVELVVTVTLVPGAGGVTTPLVVSLVGLLVAWVLAGVFVAVGAVGGFFVGVFLALDGICGF